MHRSIFAPALLAGCVDGAWPAARLGGPLALPDAAAHQRPATRAFGGLHGAAAPHVFQQASLNGGAA